MFISSCNATYVTFSPGGGLLHESYLRAQLTRCAFTYISRNTLSRVPKRGSNPVI
jgi:hypothetical protein